eukprot:TRINITY_DN11704_c0_g1_i1.p1 TRINITY_DN11704_c0_g1~~TRINITY_DN11704_c0_g1_i1.p1  ORF type:complete len:108 (-),score=28.57 TRINITY_DN11704_c0_g1_i1:58-381(-)
MQDLRRMWKSQPKLVKDGEKVVISKNAAQNDFLTVLKNIRQKLIHHAVTACSGHCQAKVVQRCSLCSDPAPLYLFDINKAMACPRCPRLYHKACFKIQPCRWCFAEA